MTELRPIDPLLSLYPLPMSPRRARHEARRARRSSLRLPDGHPYAVAPPWLPHALAQRFERVRLAVKARLRGGLSAVAAGARRVATSLARR